MIYIENNKINVKTNINQKYCIKLCIDNLSIWQDTE